MPPAPRSFGMGCGCRTRNNDSGTPPKTARGVDVVCKLYPT
jgi:hypothetical protein